MTRTPLYIIIGVASLLLFVSCGQQQRAKSAVKDFVETHLTADACYLDFSDVDSTHAISDSLITALRQQSGKQIPYQERTGRTLMYIRAKYLDGQDTCSATFYLDRELTGVIAYKKNF